MFIIIIFIDSLEILIRDQEEEIIYPNWYCSKNLKDWKATVDFVKFNKEIENLTREVNKICGILDEKNFIHLVALDDIIHCRKANGFPVPENLLQKEKEIAQKAAEIFKTILEGKSG